MTTTILITLFIAFCVYMLVKKAKGVNPASTKLSDNNSGSLNRFDIMQINSKGIQVLESIEIIATTKNIDTLNSRIAFITDIYDELIALSNNPRYLIEAQKAIDTYRVRYYDKKLKDIQITLLTKPNVKALKEYIAACIVISFGEYVKIQVAEIEKLKKEHAIKNRKQNIVNTGYQAKYMFKTYELTSEGHLEAIEDMRKPFFARNK